MFVVGIIFVFVSFILDITSCVPVTVVLGATVSPDKKEVDNKMNKIMIPISFVLLLVVALIAWLLNRSHKKKKAQEEREMHLRYTNLLKAKTAQVNSTEPMTTDSTLPVDNSSKIPMTQFPRKVCEQDNSEDEDDIPPQENRYRRRKKKMKKTVGKNASADESSDVCENEVPKSDLPERFKKKSRRRRARKSGERDQRIMREQDGIQNAPDEPIGEKERGYQDKGNCEVNGGFQRDSGNVSSPTRTSGGDPAEQQSQPRNLSPILNGSIEL